MLSDDQKAEITMMMHVVNHLQSNLPIIGEDAEMMDALSQLKTTVGGILDRISEEERDGLLEQYKEEAPFLGLTK